MPRQILFLDKDDTLGEFEKGDCGLYRGAKSFLRQQKESGRELHILTTAGNQRKGDLSEIEELLTGYWGADQINGLLGFYHASDGLVRRVDDDYDIKAGKLVHKETGAAFHGGSWYRNPHTDEVSNHPRHFGILKDIHLAKRLISQDSYANLHSVMVGDEGDQRRYAISDPLTPLFVINARSSQEWKAAHLAVNALFGDGTKFPWQVYDDLFRVAQPAQDGTKTLQLGSISLNLSKGDNNTRFISWNYQTK